MRNLRVLQLHINSNFNTSSHRLSSDFHTIVCLYLFLKFSIPCQTDASSLLEGYRCAHLIWILFKGIRVRKLDGIHSVGYEKVGLQSECAYLRIFIPILSESPTPPSQKIVAPARCMTSIDKRPTVISTCQHVNFTFDLASRIVRKWDDVALSVA